MKSTVQLITTPTADTPGTTLSLQYNSKRYLIGNLSEGTQRACTEQMVGFKNTQDVLITGRTDWHNVGGLIGVLLTMADQRGKAAADSTEDMKPEDLGLHLHGTTNLKHTLATSRRFIFRKNTPIYPHEHKITTPIFNEQGNIVPTWTDENIRVWAMTLDPAIASERSSPVYTNRKRSYDEAMGWSEPDSETLLAEREARYDTMRESIVADMFTSNWSLDALYEMPLSKVKMPCKIFYRDPDMKGIQEYQGPKPGEGKPLPDINVLVRQPWPAAMIAKIPPSRPSAHAVSYIIRNHEQRGKFDPKKAKELGITEVKKFGKLTAGESVENGKGEVVRPDMVMSPSRPGGGFAVVDLPGLEYISPLIAREEWSSDPVMERVENIVWILAPGVLADTRLQSFMAKLAEDRKIRHVISSPDLCPNDVAFGSAAAQSQLLHQIDPVRYQVPLSNESKVPQDVLTPGANSNCDISGITGAIRAERGMTFELEAVKKSPVHEVEDDDDGMGPAVLQLADSARAAIQRDRSKLNAWRKNIPSPETEIFPLGTGSALPSKYRNASATLIRVPGQGYYLFDCGEDTLGQIMRVFGPVKSRDILKELRCIWISHLHADHHLGVTSVIRAWRDVVIGKPSPNQPINNAKVEQNLNFRRLTIVSDANMIRWLHEYADVEDYGLSHILTISITGSQQLQFKGLDGGQTLRIIQPNQEPLMFASESFAYQTGISKIRAVDVDHCMGSKAVSMTWPSGLKISYSGDCRPSNDFVEIGKDSTLLIHEATFDDELHGDAVAKKHSTTGEALDIAQRMGAKAVLLTHFSARYQKMPVIEVADNAAENATDTNLPHLISDISDLAPEEPDAFDAPDAFDEPEAEAFDEPDAPAAPEPAPAPAPAPLNDAPTAVFKIANPDLKVGVAFDLMRIQLDQFAELAYFHVPLVALVAAQARAKGQKKERARRFIEERTKARLEGGLAKGRQQQQMQKQKGVEKKRVGNGDGKKQEAQGQGRERKQVQQGNKRVQTPPFNEEQGKPVGSERNESPKAPVWSPPTTEQDRASDGKVGFGDA